MITWPCPVLSGRANITTVYFRRVEGYSQGQASGYFLFHISVSSLVPAKEALFKFMGIQVSGNNVSVYLTCIGFIDHRLQRKVPRCTKFPSETENYINTRYVEKSNKRP